MDRNTVIGLFLLGLVLTVFSVYNQPSQAEIDADRERMMGNFTDSVQRHKQRMVAEAFNRGEISLFRKR